MDELEFYDGAWTGQEIDAGIGLTGTLANALAVVVDGNKAAVSAAIGQYVLVKNSTITGISDGLYKAAKALPANTTLDGTYFSSAVTAGGLNDLKNAVTGSIPLTLDGGTYTTPLTSGIVKYVKYGRVTQLYIDFKIAADATSSTSYFYMDLPAELTGLSGVYIFLPCKISNNGTPLAFATAVNTRLYVYLSTGGATPTFATAGQGIEASGMYISAT